MEEVGVPAESIDNIDASLHLRHRHGGGVVVNRPVYNEDQFRQEYEEHERQRRPIREKVTTWVRAREFTKKSVKGFFFGLVPILLWIPKYGWRKQLLPDFISGFTVGIYRLPQGMAHAILATVPPVYGLYTVFFPVLVYTLFGTSQHISIGTFAVVSIMTGDAADKVIGEITKDEVLTEEEEQQARIIAVTSLAVMVGIIQIILGMLHFGIISDYLPEPLIRGFTTGAAIHVFLSQFNKMFGIKLEKVSGPLSVLRQYIPFFPGLRQANTTEIIVSICAIIIMVVIKEVQEKYKPKYKVFKYPIPVELVVIILGTGVSAAMDFSGRYGVSVVGNVPTGLPAPIFPSFKYATYLISDAFVIAIVTFSIAVSMAYIFAKKHNYEIDANQELFAYGASNFVGGVFQCFPNTASLSRSLVQEVSGCTSQISSLVSALLILVTLLWLGPLFKTLPECCLAAIIVVALRGMFRQFRDIKILWKYSLTDMITWIVTFVLVVTFGLDIGLLGGVLFAVFTVVVRTQRPPCHIMGRIPETDIYKDVKAFKQVEEIPGIRIFRIQAPFYFSNSRYIKDRLYQKTGLCPPKILIQRAKEAKREAARQRKANGMVFLKEPEEVYQKEIDMDLENGDVRKEDVVSTMETKSLPSDKQNGNHLEESSNNTSEEPQGGTDIQPQVHIIDTSDPQAHTGDSGDTDATSGDGSSKGLENGTHTIVLDFGAVSFVDTVGMNTMKSILTEYDSIDVEVLVANVRGTVRETLRKSGLLDTIGLNKMFVSVHDAVLFKSSSIQQDQLMVINPNGSPRKGPGSPTAAEPTLEDVDEEKLEES